MKKCARIIVAVLCLSFVLAPSVAAATNLGTIKKWSADYAHQNGGVSNVINQWEYYDPTYHAEKRPSAANDTTFPLISETGFAITQWNSALSTSASYVASMDDAGIKVFGGSKDELAELGFTVDSGSAGLTLTPWLDHKGYYVYELDGSHKDHHHICGEVRVAIVYRPGEHTYKNYAHTILHEIGHAFGWYGHSKESSDVMYPLTNDVTTLTARDKEHLQQVYKEG